MKICLWHKWEVFSIGRFPLGTRYCFKCGCLDVGNVIYYDGSIYQKRYRGKKAIEYIEDKLEYIQNYRRSSEKFKAQFGIGYDNINDVLGEYESEEKYKEIIYQMKVVNKLFDD